jgi:hypothetical protein
LFQVAARVKRLDARGPKFLAAPRDVSALYQRDTFETVQQPSRHQIDTAPAENRAIEAALTPTF